MNLEERNQRLSNIPGNKIAEEIIKDSIYKKPRHKQIFARRPVCQSHTFGPGGLINVYTRHEFISRFLVNGFVM